VIVEDVHQTGFHIFVWIADNDIDWATVDSAVVIYNTLFSLYIFSLLTDSAYAGDILCLEIVYNFSFL